MAPGTPVGEALSRLLSHSGADRAPSSPPALSPAALADALLAQSQRATDPATVKALVDAARALLNGG